MKKSNNFAHAAMLIRKPIAEVFEAFTNPEITTQFWFTHSQGKLEEGKTTEWTWEMYDLSIEVDILKLTPNEIIIFEWENRGQKTKVECEFKSLDKYKTFVSIVNYGFSGTNEEIISTIRDSTGGFSWVLAGLKAYLEYGIKLNLTADRFPKEIGFH